MRPTIVLVLFLSSSLFAAGCIDSGRPQVLQVLTTTAYESEAQGEASRRAVAPHLFYAPNGTLHHGFLDWDPENPTANQFYLPNGPTGARVAWTPLNGHAYNWEMFSPRVLGFYLIGEPLHTGESGRSQFGLTQVEWEILEADQDRLRIAWHRTDLPGVTYQSTFDPPSPIPIQTETRYLEHGKNRFVNNTLLGPSQVDVPIPVPQEPLALVEKETDGDIFKIWSDSPLSFREAQQIWKEDARYAQSQMWFKGHPDAVPVEVRYHELDENDGNASVYLWRARYYDAPEILSVGVAWRVTHPTEEMRREYPLYDQCPDGCVHPYGQLPRISANISYQGELIEWPERSASIESLVARSDGLIPDLPARNMEWRLVERGLQEGQWFALDDPEVRTIHDIHRSYWDPDPSIGSPGGRPESESLPFRFTATYDMEDGYLLRAKTPQRLF